MSISPSGQERKAWDLNPHPRKGARFSKPARPAVSDYLPFQWTRRESNSDFRHARAVSSLWTTSPLCCQWTGWESNPSHRSCRDQSPPRNMPAHKFKRSVRELNPVFLLTEEVCCRNTYRPSNDPGRTRTVVFLAVAQASLPLDHGIISPVTEVGVEPTGTRLSTSPLCQFAYPVVSGGSGSCTRRSRLMKPG